MAERLKAAVLKIAVRETVPGVRIPLPPPPDVARVRLDSLLRELWRGSRRSSGRRMSGRTVAKADGHWTFARLGLATLLRRASDRQGSDRRRLSRHTSYTDRVEFRLQRTIRVMSAAEHATGRPSRESWRSRPPEERFAAVEFLRRQHGGTGAGLRRVLRVLDRPRS